MVINSLTVPQSSRIVEMAGGIISGVSVGYFAAWVRDSGGMPSSDYMKFMFLATCTYFVVALLTPQMRGTLTRRIPRWAAVAILGAMLTFIAINLVGDVRHIINFQVNSLSTFITAARGEFERFTANTLVFSFISLPIMGATYYIGRRVLMIRHNAPSEDDMT